MLSRAVCGPPGAARWLSPAAAAHAGDARRGFHATAAIADSMTVSIPEMGDSITEGSICAVLKSVGACAPPCVSVCRSATGALPRLVRISVHGLADVWATASGISQGTRWRRMR